MAAVEAVTSLVTKMQPCLACCNECEGEGEGVDLHAPRLVRTSVLHGTSGGSESETTQTV